VLLLLFQLVLPVLFQWCCQCCPSGAASAVPVVLLLLFQWCCQCCSNGAASAVSISAASAVSVVLPVLF